jgi:hypothetical protein
MVGAPIIHVPFPLSLTTSEVLFVMQNRNYYIQVHALNYLMCEQSSILVIICTFNHFNFTTFSIFCQEKTWHQRIVFNSFAELRFYK